MAFDATAYYVESGEVIFARRDVGAAEWTTTRTGLFGAVDDAHNVISLAVDGNGMVHLAWGMHNSRLRYATSVAGGAGPFVVDSMLGTEESRVTYPEFYARSDGGLYFLYRDGESGAGDLVLNRFDATAGLWMRVSHALVSGAGEYSPYWQAALDSRDRLHLSWTWRESDDASTNSDIMYAVAADASGETWTTSSGVAYDLPITPTTAEVAVGVVAGSNLINQTGMTTDDDGRPFIATYWRTGEVTQYMVVALDAEGEWTVTNTGLRTTSFELGGIGTRALPLARPDIAVTGTGMDAKVHLLLRDDERDGAFTIASGRLSDDSSWGVRDLTMGTHLGRWEPTYDRDAWRTDGILMVYVQRVMQPDGDGDAVVRSAPAYVVEVDPSTLG